MIVVLSVSIRFKLDIWDKMSALKVNIGKQFIGFRGHLCHAIGDTFGLFQIKKKDILFYVS